MFEGIAEKAEAGWQETPGTTDTSTQQTTGNETGAPDLQTQSHSDAAPELQRHETQTNNFDKQPQNVSPEQQRALDSIADLSKFEKVKLPDGSEMTKDELTRAIMRQQDYTKKTQEAAKIRAEAEELKTRYEQQSEQFKYESNYQADLRKVLANPHLLNDFYKTYPREYWSKLDQDLQRNGQENHQRIDPAYAKSLQKQHEFEAELSSLKEERQRDDLMFVDTRLKSLETTLSTKYPKADMASVYAQLDLEAQNQGVDLRAIKANPQLLDTTMEKLAKASHEKFLKSYEDYAKEKSKQQIQANNKGSDIGRGGGTPGAPKVATKLKDVDMFAAMKAAGAL